jgi:hypothetical protein
MFYVDACELVESTEYRIFLDADRFKIMSEINQLEYESSQRIFWQKM